MLQNTVAMQPETAIEDRAHRKRVKKACDRCRLKKSKCDGDSPCSRCKRGNLICIFGERRKARGRLYSQDYVELLEHQQAQLTAGVQMLYDRIQHGGDYAELRVDPAQCHDGHSTHAILEALGLLDDMPATDASPVPSEGVASQHHSPPELACDESLRKTDATLVPNMKQERKPSPETTAPIMDQRNETSSFASSTTTPLLEIGQMRSERWIAVPNTVTWDTGGNEGPPWKCGNIAYEGDFKERDAWTLPQESTNYTNFPAEEALMFTFDPASQLYYQIP